MLDYGKRGILVEPNLEDVLNKIKVCLKDKSVLKFMSEQAVKWSQNYTLDAFEMEISKLLNNQ